MQWWSCQSDHRTEWCALEHIIQYNSLLRVTNPNVNELKYKLIITRKGQIYTGGFWFLWLT